MNWSWGYEEDYFNGWYAAGEFWKSRNTNDNFEFTRSMIYHIKP